MLEKIKVSSVVWHLNTGLRDLRLPSPKRSSGFAQAGGSEPAVPKPTDKAANPIIGAGPVVFDNLSADTPWSAGGARGIWEFGAS